jgi:molybdopterin/thiamine biosynthesis adenylyltransferase
MEKWYKIITADTQPESSVVSQIQNHGTYNKDLHTGARIIVAYSLALNSIGKSLNTNYHISPFTGNRLLLPCSVTPGLLANVWSTLPKDASLFANSTVEEEEDFLKLTGLTLTQFRSFITENTQVESFHSRFSGAIWMPVEEDITVIGAGGIGSHLIFQLSRLSPRSMCVYDPDTIEPANRSGQLYSGRDRISKVSAIRNFVQQYSDFFNMTSFFRPFTQAETLNSIVFTGLDNMNARREVFEKWKTLNDGILIDGRLAAETFQVYCIRGNDEKAKEKYSKEALFSSEEAAPTICSYKQTTHVASMIASVMVSLFTNYLSNKKYNVEVRDVPYFTEISISELKMIVEQ